MKYTPGPWHVGMKPGPIIYGPSGEQIADMREMLLTMDEHLANTQLIMLAPKMFELLKAYNIMAPAPEAKQLIEKIEGGK